MTKDVLLTIRGLQFDLQEEETSVETVTAAEYYKKNDCHYLLYEDPAEGLEGVTRNVIRFREGYLCLTRKGVSNVHMVFEENKMNRADYSTPFGDLLVGVEARKVRLREREEQIRVDVDYALEINYEPLADCRLSMEILQR